MAKVILDEKSLPVTAQEAREIGSKRYFTGRPCKRGHISERYVRGQCIECCKAYDKRWRDDNLEKSRAYGRAKYARNPEAVRARAAAWYEANKEKASATRKVYRERNIEASRRRRDAWIAANAIKHADSKRASVRRRRARKSGAGGDHTAAQIQNLIRLRRYRCAACLASVRKGYHADHIMPIAKGGSNSIRNIQILCAGCNHRKSSKDPIVWAQENGRLL